MSCTGVVELIFCSSLLLSGFSQFESVGVFKVEESDR